MNRLDGFTRVEDMGMAFCFFLFSMERTEWKKDWLILYAFSAFCDLAELALYR